MNDWFNWIRLFVLMPTAIYATIKAFRDLPKGHVGRGWVLLMAAHYVIYSGRLVLEDLGWIAAQR